MLGISTEEGRIFHIKYEKRDPTIVSRARYEKSIKVKYQISVVVFSKYQENANLNTSTRITMLEFQAKCFPIYRSVS